eukprot:TRINITY_DN27466_c0_g1_i1.p2 TRINITY_DN27466_c0_g1~~TRINITY_DN27466_c0_g1_i1.p2  ORF type:complete len:163 (-),score=0.13 TRINITY_DN27466_c0_g1_i1:266-703(-)
MGDPQAFWVNVSVSVNSPQAQNHGDVTSSSVGDSGSGGWVCEVSEVSALGIIGVVRKEEGFGQCRTASAPLSIIENPPRSQPSAHNSMIINTAMMVANTCTPTMIAVHMLVTFAIVRQILFSGFCTILHIRGGFLLVKDRMSTTQ